MNQMDQMDRPLLPASNAQHSVEIQQSISRFQQFSRWFLSVLCVAFFLASLAIYQIKGILTSTQVSTFNGITTILVVILGICFFDAFKDLANVLRWRILARTGWSDLEKKLIKDIAKLTVVCELWWKSRTKRSVLLVCFLWIVFNMSAQVALALTNQVYSMQDGTDWNGTYIRPGQVNASDLSCYYHHTYDTHKYTCEHSSESLHGIVHNYGASAFDSLSYGSDCVNYTDVEDILRSRSNPKYFCRRSPGQQEFAYRFLEYNPHDSQRTYPYLTDRVITVSAGQCYQYSLSVVEPTGENLVNYTFTNKTFSGSIQIPSQIRSFDGTVYIYRSLEPPETTTEWRCNSRCIWMWAHKTQTNSDNSTFYQCPVTFNVVQSASQDELQVEHQVPDNIARLAASSIGLQGGNSDPDKGWTQFQFYPVSNPWDIHLKGTDEVGANMAEFALGSIATMASYNPPIQIPGHLPTLGSRLKVDWPFAFSLLICIAGVHSALFAFTMYTDWRNKNFLLNQGTA